MVMRKLANRFTCNINVLTKRRIGRSTVETPFDAVGITMHVYIYTRIVDGLVQKTKLFAANTIRFTVILRAFCMFDNNRVGGHDVF